MDQVASPRSEFLAGMKGIAPILPGVLPFGTISGIVAVEVGISVKLAVLMSLIVYAGASQLAAVQLIGMAASPLVTVLTTWIINLRFAMYSTSMAPYLKEAATRWKYLLAYLLTDQVFAICAVRFNRHPDRPYKHWYYLGAATLMWLTWQSGAMAGIFLGASVPESWSLDFAVPLTFLSLIVPAIQDRASTAAALVAGVMSVAAFALPYNLGLITAALTGIGAGLLVETWARRMSAGSPPRPAVRPSEVGGEG
ncbi:MAG: branched-chain amino acid ABC transporter permease [Chloroflexi bacterium]|nr:MAG: branched-chain amino acid ABC transporter permease [Chloroflexota bacterium]